MNKHGETLCGGQGGIGRRRRRDLTLVLADGLGSGVKANILSTLTSKILCTMISGGIPLRNASPPSQARCRCAACARWPIRPSPSSGFWTTKPRTSSSLTTRHHRAQEGRRCSTIPGDARLSGKTIWESTFPIELDDVFIAMSDGAEYAGVGDLMNFGWTRDSIADYAMANYLPENSAKFTAGLIIDECDRLYGGSPGDDTTVAVVRVRSRHPVNLVVGPPEHKEDDVRMMNLFFGKEGTKIVCGGTTSNRRLPLPGPAHQSPRWTTTTPTCRPSAASRASISPPRRDHPLQGAHLRRGLSGSGELASVWATQKDGASLIARELFENRDRRQLLRGPRHQPRAPEPQPAHHLWHQAAADHQPGRLPQKMGKHVRLSYF